MALELDYLKSQKNPPAMLRPLDKLLDQQQPKLLVDYLVSMRIS